jgi:uncharacterized phiE125 gp8 family phage protein
MLRELTPAAILPTSLAELKQFLRIEHDIEDALLAALLRSATQSVESFIGLILIQRVFEQRWQASPNNPIQLTCSPVINVVSLAIDGQTVPPADFQLQTDDSGVMVLTLLTAEKGNASAQFVAGSAVGWNDIPEAVRFGIQRLAAHLYAHRDNAAAPAIPSSVLALLQPFRKVRL